MGLVQFFWFHSLVWFSDPAFFRRDDKLRMTWIAVYMLLPQIIFTMLPGLCLQGGYGHSPVFSSGVAAVQQPCFEHESMLSDFVGVPCQHGPRNWPVFPNPWSMISMKYKFVFHWWCFICGHWSAALLAANTLSRSRRHLQQKRAALSDLLNVLQFCACLGFSMYRIVRLSLSLVKNEK